MILHLCAVSKKIIYLLLLFYITNVLARRRVLFLNWMVLCSVTLRVYRLGCEVRYVGMSQASSMRKKMLSLSFSQMCLCFLQTFYLIP